MLEFFFKGGPLMYPLLFCSVLTLFLILERALHHLVSTPRRSFPVKIKSLIEKGDYGQAHSLALKSGGALGTVLAEALKYREKEPIVIEEAISSKGSYELKGLTRNLHILELIGRIAPLIGLLGTVLGMVEAFQKVSIHKSAVDPSTLAGGIWQALLTTVAGLFVAIPALVSLHFFENRVKWFAFQIKHHGVEIVNLLGEKNDRA